MHLAQKKSVHITNLPISSPTVQTLLAECETGSGGDRATVRGRCPHMEEMYWEFHAMYSVRNSSRAARGQLSASPALILQGNQDRVLRQYWRAGGRESRSGDLEFRWLGLA
jgi:hypothetical protein